MQSKEGQRKLQSGIYPALSSTGKIRGWFVIPTTPASGQLFISSFTLYAYDAAKVMDNEYFVTVLESYVTILSLQVAQINTQKIHST